MKDLWRAETGFFFLLWLGLLVAGRGGLFRDPDTFWHTVAGERILATGTFFDKDPFSYTRAGATWIPHQWLGECTMAVLDRVAGLDGLLLGCATLLAGLYTWAASRLLRAGFHWSLTGVLLILAVAASASHFHIRPHLGTMLFLAITFALLCDVEAGRTPLARLGWLVPLFIVWTNTHGGMLGGWITALVVFGLWTLAWIMGRPAPIGNVRQMSFLLVVLLLCGLTCLINPYGIRTPQVWLEIMNAPLLPQIVAEHVPLAPLSIPGILVLVFAAVYIVVRLGLLPGQPRACALIPLIWFLLTVTRIRHAPLFALTALLALAEILPHTSWARRWAETRPDLYVPPGPGSAHSGSWRAAVLPVLAVALALGLQSQGVQAPVFGQGWVQLSERDWPVGLLPELRQRQTGENRIFNEYNHGGFLIYFTPGLKVFVDGRCELYGDRWLFDLLHCERHATAKCMEAYQKTYGMFDLALTRAGSGYDDYFRTCPDWRHVKQALAANFYERRPAP